LNKLKVIEKGDVYLKTESLCMFDSINWSSILNKMNGININKQNVEYAKNNCCKYFDKILSIIIFKLNLINSKAKDGYVCDPSCNGCWSTGAHSCQFCKTYKLEDRCVETCESNQMVDNRYLYLKNNSTRECNYCHKECRKGCEGETDMDCFECKNYKLILNGNQFQCVNSCPITHYNDPINKLCLPGYRDCFGCTGPNKTIGPKGCTKCSSALVDNDPAYTILKCILLEEFGCESNGHFIDHVHLTSHPLKGKSVCRKCNDECDGCYKSGDNLNSQCKKCKYFLSKSNNRCVFNCTAHNEYTELNTKVFKFSTE
jgi:L1 cell adhesion molecule